MRTFSLLLAALVVMAVPLTSSAQVDVLRFDSASGNGSLYERVSDGTIEPRVREIQTIKLNGVPYLVERSYQANMRELRMYAGSFACRSGLDTSKCLPIKK